MYYIIENKLEANEYFYDPDSKELDLMLYIFEINDEGNDLEVEDFMYFNGTTFVVKFKEAGFKFY